MAWSSKGSSYPLIFKIWPTIQMNGIITLNEFHNWRSPESISHRCIAYTSGNHAHQSVFNWYEISVWASVIFIRRAMNVVKLTRDLGKIKPRYGDVILIFLLKISSPMCWEYFQLWHFFNPMNFYRLLDSWTVYNISTITIFVRHKLFSSVASRGSTRWLYKPNSLLAFPTSFDFRSLFASLRSLVNLVFRSSFEFSRLYLYQSLNSPKRIRAMMLTRDVSFHDAPAL